MNFKYIFLIFNISLLLFSCEKISKDETPQLKVLGSEIIEVSDKGGKYEIKYEIINPRIDGTTKVVINDAWITLIDHSADGIISLNITENITNESRQSDLKIAYIYDDKAIDKKILINQSYSDLSSFIKIEANPEYTSAKITFSPENPNMLYAARVIEKEKFNKFSNINELVNFDKAYYEDLSSTYNISISDAVTMSGGYGQKEIVYKDLEPGIEYIAYAYGINDKYELISTEVNSLNFNTLAVEMIDCHFDITCTQVGLMASGNITPDRNDIHYYSSILEKNYLHTYGNDITSQVKGFVQTIIDQFYGGNIDRFITENCHMGMSEYIENEIKAGTEYIVFAVGIDEHGMCNTEVSSISFVSGTGGNPKDLEISFKIEQITNYGASVSCIPSDYFINYYWDVAVSTSTEDEIMNNLNAAAYYSGLSLNRFLLEHASRGESNFDFFSLEENTKYNIYFIPLNNDGSPAKSIVISDGFTTLATK